MKVLSFNSATRRFGSPIPTHQTHTTQTDTTMKSLSTILAIFALAVTVNGADEPKKPDGGKKPPMDPAEMLKKLDTDKNGSVSKEEFMASPAALFGQLILFGGEALTTEIPEPNEG